MTAPRTRGERRRAGCGNVGGSSCGLRLRRLPYTVGSGGDRCQSPERRHVPLDRRGAYSCPGALVPVGERGSRGRIRDKRPSLAERNLHL